MFLGFILIRVLFVACMVFIIGYVFGSFSETLMLRRITRIAAILAIVLFFLSNIFVMRDVWADRHSGIHVRSGCQYEASDSTSVHREHF